MNLCSIKLNPHITYFEEIYFSNGRGLLIKNKLTRGPLIRLCFFLLLTGLFFLLDDQKLGFGWLALFSAFLTIFFAVMFGIAAKQFYSWKTSVQSYLRRVRQIKKATLELHSDSFHLEIDDQLVIQRLDTLKKIDITPQWIHLQADTENYFFPSKSMAKDEYAFLTSYFKKESLQITKAIIGR